MSELGKKLKQLGLKILVYLLEGLIYTKRFAVLLLFLFASLLKYPAHLFLEHFILPLYRLYLFLRRAVFRAPLQKLKNLYRWIFPKFLLHFFIAVIAIFVLGNNIYAQIKPPEDFGKRNLLSSLVGGDVGAADNNDFFIETVGPYIPQKQYLKQGAHLSAAPKEERLVEEPYRLTKKTEGFLSAEGVEGYTIPETRVALTEYVVLPGDTISDLAELFGISVNTILWANKMSVRDTLRPGQKLIIPPTSGVIHKIVKNDTVEKIAAKYKAAKDKIIAFNPGAETGLTVGEMLIVPDGAMPLPPQARPRPIAPPSAIFAPSPEIFAGARMIWPTIPRRITQYFKWNHAGIDIGGPAGTPIYASDDGIVEYAGWGSGGWGNTVVINHGDGRKTRYSHASKILTARGAQAAKGQVIALIGSTGRSTGPHVDFRIYINGRTANPLDYVR